MSKNWPVMRTWYYVVSCALLILLLYPPSAIADVGTWWTAQSASVAPDGESTQVQMVAEEVLLIVEPLDPPADQEWVRIDELMAIHVEAAFLMRNQGTETEAFDVWFPLTAGALQDDNSIFPSRLENFRAWVDGDPAPVEERPGRDLLGLQDEAPWAAWPVVFPPGQDVTLRVTYDTYPAEWGGWAIVHYILETGAGWRGPIGEGTVTFRLPYEVTPQNVQLAEIREAYTGLERPFEIIVEDTDVVWRFTDLEPRPSGTLWEDSPLADTDNLILPMMKPTDWLEIEAARADVEAHPVSADAHLRLAQALEEGAQTIKSALDTEANDLLLTEADAARQRALDLAAQATPTPTTTPQATSILTPTRTPTSAQTPMATPT
ncbi:MAG TPA: hypothetical protein ENN19_01755, partial [Chloroflexi bacterium]|nr:hypothetical protein [Chloroflexota bacterium]